MSCATLATETQFSTQLVTTNSLSTSFSTQVTTIPGKTVTSTTTICLDTNTSDATTCSSTSLSVITTTSPDSTSTTSVPVTLTVPVIITTSAPTRTLFSTTCSTTTTTTPLTTTTTTTSTSDTLTSSSSPTPSPTSDSTPFTSLSTPPPVVSTFASSTTLPNGSVLTTDFVVTTTLPPSPVVITPTLNRASGGGGTSAKTAPIVGGVVGGVIGLLVLLGGIWFLWRRSKSWNDILDEVEDQERRPRMSLDGEDVAPRPYHYGLVGHSPSPPGSPPLARVNSGHSPSNSISMLNNPVNQHSRSSSALTVPSPGSMSRSMSDLSAIPVAAGQASHVRPNLSTSSSTRPLLERAIIQTRPPSSWSVGGQSIGPGLELPPSSGQQGVALGPRPHSAGENMQSVVGSSDVTLPPRSSQATEKHRLRSSLPLGAAAPTPPAPTIPAIPGPRSPTVQSPREGAPPLTPRNPKRPSSAKNQDTSVLVHIDGGPAGPSNSQQAESRVSNAPPAYSPT